MHNQQLKQDILSDMDFLQKANIEIMEKDEYYKKIKHYSKIYFLMLFCPILFFGVLFNCRQIFLAFWTGDLRDIFEQVIWIPEALIVIIPFMMGFASHCGRFLIFKEQLLPYLKTKNLIEENLERAMKNTYFIYVIWIGFWMSFCHPVAIIIIQLLGIAISIAITTWKLELEVDRIGAAVIFEYLKRFFDDKKNIHHSII